MIPEIGVMVGAYIVTRMLELIVGPNSRAAVITRAFAIVTILVSLVVIADLALRGTTGLDLSDMK